jgi:hypothetical protein
MIINEFIERQTNELKQNEARRQTAGSTWH